MCYSIIMYNAKIILLKTTIVIVYDQIVGGAIVTWTYAILSVVTTGECGNVSLILSYTTVVDGPLVWTQYATLSCIISSFKCIGICKYTCNVILHTKMNGRKS